MKVLSRNLMLAAVLVLCVAPSSFAGSNRPRPRRVPEGGSAAVYLLGVGLTCLGAMVIRSRSLKAN